MARTPFIGSGIVQQGGYSATHKQDFNAHTQGGGYKHTADQIVVNPLILSQDNVQEALDSLATTVTSINHSTLTNLTSDDHLQYLNRSGVRKMTGDFNIDTFKIVAADGLLTQDVISTDGSANIVLGSVGGNQVNVLSTNVNLSGNSINIATVNESGPGNISLQAGADTFDGDGGDITVTAGAASLNNSGGSITLTAGNSPSGDGGNISINGGNTTITGVGGNVSISAGVGISSNGSVILRSGSPIADTLQVSNHSLVFKTSGASLDTSQTDIRVARVTLISSVKALVACKKETGAGDRYINFECLNYASI